ncbi:MAG TPA: hypothetical protein VGG64_13105 [Pirellulales bacterium]|jgi:hypothetical protein
MRRNFSWIAISGAMLLVLDGCQVGAWSTPSQEHRIFMRNLASSLDNRDSTLWVTRPNVYGAEINNGRTRGFTSSGRR